MLRILKQYYPVRNAVFVVGEGMFIFVSVVIATWIIIGNTFFLTDRALALKAILIVSVCPAVPLLQRPLRPEDNGHQI